MTLNNIKTMKQDRGFTIVELLIVIVIIAILAAITIVAYNGIQNRANNSAAQALANNVIKKADIYFTTNSAYPTLAEFDGNFAPGATTFTAPGGGAEAKLDTATANATQATAPANKDQVQYEKCGNNGARVTYWQSGGNVVRNLGEPVCP